MSIGAENETDEKQTIRFLFYAGITWILFLGCLATSKAIMEPETFSQLLDVLLRVACLSLFGGGFGLGLFILADLTLPGSLSNAIVYEKNMAAAVFGSAIMLVGVACLYIR